MFAISSEFDGKRAFHHSLHAAYCTHQLNPDAKAE
jgi:hypothetical protein